MYREHYDRLTRAITLQETDRPPVFYNCEVFTARYMGLKLGEMISDFERACLLIQAGMLLVGGGEIDASSAGMYPPSRETISYMKLPGRDLGMDELWQIDERELMTVEDYDTIIDKGYAVFRQEYTKRINNGAMAEKMQEVAPVMGRLERNLKDIGIVNFTSVFADAFVETFCSMRTMPGFFRDLHRIPDKVQAAMDVMIEEHLAELRRQIREQKPFSVFVGGSRSAFISNKLFERFDLPYRRRIVDTVIEEGSFVNFHLDADWGPKLHYFLDFPKGKCCLSLDGTTDIFQAKKVLDGHMALLGDVPSTLLSLGTPEEVYEYSSRLVREIGPGGFILAAGCSAPPNAKPENIKAMICAATGK